jgi:hypothetical protein
MHDDNVRMFIRDEMVEAGIVEESGNTLSYFHNDREYLILLSVVDITNWDSDRDIENE